MKRQSVVVASLLVAGLSGGAIFVQPTNSSAQPPLPDKSINGRIVPREKPGNVTVRVDGNGSAIQRAEAASSSCRQAFSKFASGKVVAAMGLRGGELNGLVADDSTIVSKGAIEKPADEGVAVCFVDGLLEKAIEYPDLTSPADLQRALYIIGSSGVPELFAVGSLDNVQVVSPRGNGKLRKYPAEPDSGPPKSRTTIPEPVDSKRTKPATTVPDEGYAGQVTPASAKS
jgi:hypothetical protein